MKFVAIGCVLSSSKCIKANFRPGYSAPDSAYMSGWNGRIGSQTFVSEHTHKTHSSVTTKCHAGQQ